MQNQTHGRAHGHVGHEGHASIRVATAADLARIRRVHRLGRRRFLADLGRGTFAVAILGGLAACSNNGEQPAAVPDRPDGGTNAPTTSAGSEVTVPGVDELRWAQVPLGFVSAYVLVRGNAAAIVDTGTAGSDDEIGATLATFGLTYDDVDHVILTHNHPDHIGSFPTVMSVASAAAAYAGAADIPSITGATVTAVGDGDDVFGLQVIETPGHTPGSISVFDPGIGLLLAGDALNGNDDGTTITGPNAQFTADMDEAQRSVAKLAALDVRAAAFGHGQPVESGAGALIRALAT
jgi:glyoxylase-like metal-dependent hydrolase (beta-lactamase superfamily II)